MKFTSATAALLAAPLVAAAPRHSQPKKCGLNELAVDAGLLYFGTAVDNPSLNNTKYVSIARDRNEFGQVTPANGQKWMYIEPERNVFNFSLADEIIKPARAAGQLTRCHNLVWHNQLPDWLTGTNWTKAELTSILENHIKNEVAHFKGQCYAWDVVNEAFNEDGTIRDSIWSRILGSDFIATAFQFASKYEKKAKLYYNDYNIETVQNKSDSVRTLVKDLKSRGIKIDGVGLQSHFQIGMSPSYDQQLTNMNAFNKLGVEVAITELDVRMILPETKANNTAQANVYADSVRACLDAKKCVGVTVWDFYDPFSWIPTAGASFVGQGDADLYWANFTQKPAWYAVADVLRND